MALEIPHPRVTDDQQTQNLDRLKPWAEQVDTDVAALQAALVAAAAGTIQPDDTASAGSASSFARSDHRHAIAAAAASTISGTNAEGSSTSFARADHNHALPDWGTNFATPSTSPPASTAAVVDRVYFVRVQVLRQATLTGLQFYVVVSSGNVRCALYNSAGTRVANRTTNAAVGGGLTVQQVAFDSTYAAAPGIYYMALVFSSATCQTFMHVPALPSGFVAGPGSTATATSITAPTTISTTTVPTMSTY